MKHRRNLAVGAVTAIVVTAALVGTTLPDLVADRTTTATEQSEQEDAANETFVVTELPDTASDQEVSTAKESDQAREELIADITGRIDQASERANELEAELQRQQSLATARMEEAAEAAEDAEQAEADAEAALAMDASSEYQQEDASAADVLLGDEDTLAEDATDQQREQQAEQDAVDAEQAAREAEAAQERADQAAEETANDLETFSDDTAANATDRRDLGENVRENLEALMELESWEGDFESFLTEVLGNADYLDENGDIDSVQLTYRIQALRADAEQTQVVAAESEEDAQEPAEEATQEPAEGATQEPAEEATQEPSEEETQEPAEDATQEPSEEETQEPAEETTQESAEEATQEPAGEETQEPAGEETQEPSEEPTESQTPSTEPSEEPSEDADEPQQASTAAADTDGEAASADESSEAVGFDSLTDEQQDLLARGAEAEGAESAEEYYSVVLDNEDLTSSDGTVDWDAVRINVEHQASTEDEEDADSDDQEPTEEPSPSSTPSPTPSNSASSSPSASSTPSSNASSSPSASSDSGTESAQSSGAASFGSLSSDQQELLAESGELEGVSSAREYYGYVLDNSNFTTSGGSVNWTVLEGHLTYLQAQEEAEEAASSPSPTQSSTPSPTPTQTSEPTPTSTPTQTPEPSQTSTSSQTSEPTPTSTPSSTPSQTSTSSETSTPSIPSWGELSSSQQDLLSTGADLEPGFSGGGSEYYRAVLNNSDLTTSSGNVSDQALRWHVNYLEDQHTSSSTPSATPTPSQTQTSTPTPTQTQTSTPTPTQTQTQSSNAQPASGGSSNAAQIAINWAVNTANRSDTYYSLGANGPNGWDCSSLVQQAYAQAGVNLGRTTYDQITQGRQVSWGDRQPGDLIFWGDYHVAIYLGNGQIVDAGSPSSGVSVRSVFGSPTSVRRVS